MKKADPQTTLTPPPAEPATRSGFAEHRPVSNPAVKSAEITADLKPDAVPAAADQKQPKEIGGPKGLEPTRYGDWERDGRCVDF
ncbi:MAG: hypothetical protein ACI8S3_002352 [Alphaproteobacteria bacterium]|jgi:hypothetical protein